MPLLRRYSTPDPAYDDWALILRDHRLEHSVGFRCNVLGGHNTKGGNMLNGFYQNNRILPGDAFNVSVY